MIIGFDCFFRVRPAPLCTKLRTITHHNAPSPICTDSSSGTLRSLKLPALGNCPSEECTASAMVLLCTALGNCPSEECTASARCCFVLNCKMQRPRQNSCGLTAHSRVPVNFIVSSDERGKSRNLFEARIRYHAKHDYLCAGKFCGSQPVISEEERDDRSSRVPALKPSTHGCFCGLLQAYHRYRPAKARYLTVRCKTAVIKLADKL